MYLKVNCCVKVLCTIQLSCFYLRKIIAYLLRKFHSYNELSIETINRIRKELIVWLGLRYLTQVVVSVWCVV